MKFYMRMFPKPTTPIDNQYLKHLTIPDRISHESLPQRGINATGRTSNDVINDFLNKGVSERQHCCVFSIKCQVSYIDFSHVTVKEP